MNQEVKSKWIAALRSGEYQQGTSGLKTDESYCCLGVLCDIYLKEHNQEWCVGEDGESRALNELCYLPNPVIKWAGLDTRSPLAGTFSLSIHNDSGVSFKYIADLIEEYL